MKPVSLLVTISIVGSAALAWVMADPCGMVPPIYLGEKSPIERTGLQQTYVFHEGGMETFVIRPGFQGNIDNFGMLIPFPTPPSIRKVPDNIFEQIKNAIDPPEVVVYAGPPIPAGADGGGGGIADSLMVMEKGVSVLKQEAVGMYEVAVLQAGSAAALATWMDDNGYQYPKGMDQVAEDYIEQKWCFVAVKTKVQNKSKADPRPGQREVRAELNPGEIFSGHVQGLGFRFQSDQLVVPMRLSAFNDGELRNIVYLLTNSPQKIRSIPEEYVVRQLSGKELVRHLTDPLPLRLIGGDFDEIPEFRRKSIQEQRNPEPRNGFAKVLFTSDIKSSREVARTGRFDDGSMLLAHEAEEKKLLAIGEHFGLRGTAYDRELSDAVKARATKATNSLLGELERFTLTVVDGDFPRDVIANENLTFARFEMPQARNSPKFYDAKVHGPAPQKTGKVISSMNPWRSGTETLEDASLQQHSSTTPFPSTWRYPASIAILSLLVAGMWWTRKN